jgi:hypothetical protein
MYGRIKTLPQLPVEIREGLCFHEALRRLGFSADNIYAGYGVTDNAPADRVFLHGKRAGQPVPVDCGCVILQLQDQGRVFTFDIRAPALTARKFGRLWIRAAKLWNNSTEEESTPIWRDSWIYQHAAELVALLLDKGFVIPVMPDVRDPEAVLPFLNLSEPTIPEA